MTNREQARLMAAAARLEQDDLQRLLRFAERMLPAAPAR